MILLCVSDLLFHRPPPASGHFETPLGGIRTGLAQRPHLFPTAPGDVFHFTAYIVYNFKFT